MGASIGGPGVAIFRKRSSFTIPHVGLAGAGLIALAVIVIAGFIALASLDIKPPTRHIEIEIPNERFAR